MRVFGIDPGSERTGYGCVETDGSRHRVVVCGAITSPARTAFPDRLMQIHGRLAALLEECQPDCVAIESVFHSVNARSALKLGHARGVAMLAAVEAGLTVFEYTPTPRFTLAAFGSALNCSLSPRMGSRGAISTAANSEDMLSPCQ